MNAFVTNATTLTSSFAPRNIAPRSTSSKRPMRNRTAPLMNALINLYEHPLLLGDKFAIENSKRDLGKFNDVASSFVVESGLWVLYSGEDSENQNKVCPLVARAGDKELLLYNNEIGNNNISSVRLLKPTSRCSVFLFEERFFKDKVIEVTEDAEKLKGVDAGKIKSFIVASGKVQAFDDKKFKGKCIEVSARSKEYFCSDTGFTVQSIKFV